MTRSPFLDTEAPPLLTGSRRRTALPTQVREKLARHKHIEVARLLDALYLQHYQPRDVITKQTAIAVGNEYGVSRKAVEKALRAEIPVYHESIRIFMPVPNQQGISTPEFPGNSSNPFTWKKPDRKSKQRGRPENEYLVPHPSGLAYRLGCTHFSYDPIRPEDLTNNKNYRKAIQRELFKRRPGEYTRTFLGDRLGVSGKTTATYDQELHTIVTPQFEGEAVDRSHLDQFLWGNEARGGTFLQDSEGKRYSPKRDLAEELLDAGYELYYVKRRPNHYAPPPQSSPFED